MASKSPPLLVVIAGPTASGKTNLGVKLAKHFNSEVVSSDSRQFYREMSIGTAKPTVEEMDGVIHHMINTLSVQDTFSVGDYEDQTLNLLADRFQEINPIFLVGGSGLFIRAICAGLDQFPEIAPSLRQALNEEFQREGLEGLLLELKETDPGYYRQVDQNNPKRIIRALEVIRSSGKPFSSFWKQGQRNRPFNILKFGLEWDRKTLYERIDLRVDLMMEAGLLNEVESLLPYHHLNALQTVGYQELFPYFEGTRSLERSIELIKRNSRRYAKRQMTWFRKEPELQFIPHDQSFDRIKESIEDWIAKHSIP